MISVRSIAHGGATGCTNALKRPRRSPGMRPAGRGGYHASCPVACDRNLRELCIEAGGDWRRLVELARVSRATLYRQLRQHGLRLRQFRDS